MQVGFIAAWYDFWIGAFYDRKKKRLYLFPFPCIGVWLQIGDPND